MIYKRVTDTEFTNTRILHDEREFRCLLLLHHSKLRGSFDRGREGRYGSRQFIIFGDLRNGSVRCLAFTALRIDFICRAHRCLRSLAPASDERVAFVPAVSYKTRPRERESERKKKKDAYRWPLKPWIKQCKSVGNNSNRMDERDEDIVGPLRE